MTEAAASVASMVATPLLKKAVVHTSALGMTNRLTNYKRWMKLKTNSGLRMRVNTQKSK